MSFDCFPANCKKDNGNPQSSFRKGSGIAHEEDKGKEEDRGAQAQKKQNHKREATGGGG